MAKKPTLNNIGTNGLGAIQTYNANMDAIEEAFDNTISRDGSTPNSMEASLDMNSNKIINLATPTSGSDAATKNYVDSVVVSGSGSGGQPIITEDLDMASYAIVNLADPTAAQEAATKSYVDTAVSGVSGGGGGDVTSVANYAALTALSSPADNSLYYVRGATAERDGGEGLFIFDSTSTATADDGKILAIDGGGAGRFFRMERPVFNVMHYGAKGDGTTDDTAAILAAIAAIPTTGDNPGGVLYFPAGKYMVASTLTIPSYTIVTGEGPTATTIDFTSQTSGPGFYTDAPAYFVIFKDLRIQNAFTHGIHLNSMSQGRIENAFIRWCGSDGIYIDNSSYQITLENIRLDANTGKGLNIEGFVTSINAQNVFARENGAEGIRINDSVYSLFDNCSSDRNGTWGWVISNNTTLTLMQCSSEENQKTAIKCAASDVIGANCLGGASGRFGYIREVTIQNFYALSNGKELGNTTPSFLTCDSDDSREIDVMLINCRDDVSAGDYDGAGYIPTNSIDISGNTRIVTFGGRFDKLTNIGAGSYYWDAMNTRNVPKFGQQFGGVNFDTYINSVLVHRTSTAGTTFRGSTIGSAFFNLLGTTDSAGSVGLAIKTSDSNASARDWAIVTGNYTRGDFCIMQSTAAGGNPVSSGALRLYISSDGNTGLGSGTPVERLTVNGAIAIPDGMGVPDTDSGWAKIYVDTADGDLKIKFGNGTIKTIVTDT